MNDTLLEVQSVSTGYGEVIVTSDMTFSVRRGTLTALIGPNGAGKTATMLAIVGLNRLERGKVEFNGEDISTKSVKERVRSGISLVLEGRRLFPGLSVWENLEIARTAVDADPANMEGVLSLFPPLQHLLQRPAGALSGGEQQMCALGRGLIAKPKLLLVDELSLGLAPIIVDQLLDTLAQINETMGTTVLFVEQDVDRALSVAEDVIVVSRGKTVKTGSRQQIVSQMPELREAFLAVE